MNILHLLLIPASLLYFLAWIFGLPHFRRKFLGLKYFWCFSILGFILHTAALAYLAFCTGRVPIANSYELTESIAWAIVLIDFAASAVLGARMAGSASILVAAALALLPALCPSFSKMVFESVEAASPDLAAVHAVSAVLSYAFLCLSAMFSGAYMLQLRALKKRTSNALAPDSLPLPRTFRLARGSLGLACLAMAVSVMLGLAAASAANFGIFMRVKFAAASILFAAMLGLLWLSFRKGLRESAFALLSIILFVASILVLIPIELRNV